MRPKASWLKMAKRVAMMVLLCLVALGCDGTSDQRLVGAWSDNRSLTVIPDSPLLFHRERTRNGLFSTLLKLSSDHTFILSGLRQIGGTWSFSDGVLTLTPEKRFQAAENAITKKLDILNVNSDFTRMNVEISSPIGKFKIVLDKTA